MKNATTNKSVLSGTRRKFLQYGTAVGVGAQTFFQSGNLKAAVTEGREVAGLNEAWPEMQYRKLGRTEHNSSRLVFGCGATLSREPHDDLLNMAFDAGVNTFDVGFQHYYGDAEKNMVDFLRQKRDEIFLISKALVAEDIDWDEAINREQAKKAAKRWTGHLDESLRTMRVDHVDAYYYMGQNNVSVINNEEIHQAFETAKAQGKVSYLGVSTHQNAANVLETAADTGWFDLAMIAITPGGWYDWQDKAILPDSPPLKDLQPILNKAKQAGMGLVGMKAGRFIAGRAWLGWGNPDAFDKYYGEDLLKAKLSAFQRSYAFVLENGLDVVNADMQNLLHLKENFVAAATSSNYFNVA